MLEKILQSDVKLLVFLNGLGSETFDGLWLIITKQAYWTPFFLFLFYLIYKKIGSKQTLFVLLFIAVLITCTDQVTNLVKNNVQRLRPCNNEDIKAIIRIVQQRNSFSFFSGHAANSMAAATFIFCLLKPYYKYMSFLFLWPLIFAYSRIYLGLHYPIDILSGFVVGIVLGFTFFKLYKKAQAKYFPIL
ncbi:phosphatase PAP2 family protein [Flavobacterium agrisoli]|uniref:Phosphatase PAP2 family protein n=1 Tax=Flavobacterium agrisoli TaxID=2793066 RepID=A0A934PMR2_9FLAO|nr:phosphatase PAP2 family protein [Flavobacterium agrisoli]MBK0370357.1 phosphatase PAP2 family protein [Flavobacterium agrisoli]